MDSDNYIMNGFSQGPHPFVTLCSAAVTDPRLANYLPIVLMLFSYLWIFGPFPVSDYVYNFQRKHLYWVNRRKWSGSG
jgi:hypothetical protein